jgi:signal transduction histidine kinase
VKDHGEGIPLENQQYIFEPFFTTKPPGEGTGLGLAMAYKIISDHQGTINVESEPGQGTRIIIELPKTAQRQYESNIAY